MTYTSTLNTASGLRRLADDFARRAHGAKGRPVIVTRSLAFAVMQELEQAAKSAEGSESSISTESEVRIDTNWLNATERLARAATPGPWDCDTSGVWTMHPDGMGGQILAAPYEGDPADGIGRVGDSYPRGINSPAETMRFIAQMHPQAVLALVALARKGLGWTESVWEEEE